MGRVAESHEPLLVNIGVRSWRAKRVLVGRRLASWAVLVRVWEIARWEREGGGGRGLGESGTLSMVIVGMVVVIGLPLKDIIGVLVCGC